MNTKESSLIFSINAGENAVNQSVSDNRVSPNIQLGEVQREETAEDITGKHLHLNDLGYNMGQKKSYSSCCS